MGEGSRNIYVLALGFEHVSLTGCKKQAGSTRGRAVLTGESPAGPCTRAFATSLIMEVKARFL